MKIGFNEATALECKGQSLMADCQAVLDIRNDLAATMDECREVTEQYSTGRSAYLRLGQLFMRLFAGLL